MSYESAVLALSPKVFLKFDETTGTAAVDSSGNGFNANHYGTVTIAQPSLLASGAGTSVAYGGSGYTDISPVGGLNSGAISLNLRVKVSSASLAGTQILASRWVNSSSGLLWLLWLDNGKPTFRVRLGSTEYTIASPSALATGQTVTLAATFDTSILRLYVDGSQVGSLAASGSLPSMSTPFEIARASSVTYGTFQADGFAYWTSALTSGQVATLHSEAVSAPAGGDLAVRLPVPIVAATGTVQVSGSLSAVLPVAKVAIDGALSDPRRAGFGLMLASTTPATVIPPTSGDALVPLHVVTPTVPVPTLVNGRPA